MAIFTSNLLVYQRVYHHVHTFSLDFPTEISFLMGKYVDTSGVDWKFFTTHPLRNHPLRVTRFGFHGHGGTPSYHPFLDEIFHEINHPMLGIPH